MILIRGACPVFPDDSERIHGSVPDPSLTEDPVRRRQSFEEIAIQLTIRIRPLPAPIERDRRRLLAPFAYELGRDDWRSLGFETHTEPM